MIYANELYVTVASKLPGVTRTTLPNIINCKSEISPEMRYRIEAVFGGKPEIWANLQMKYNLSRVAEKIKTYNLSPYRPLVRA